MATLPEQLERLEERVTRAGGTVHWARDGAEANAIIAGIAREHGADEVIKVKSLASDEIGLNEALGAARDRRDRDRPRRADRPARRRRAVPHPRPRDPPQPRGDRGAVRAHDRAGAGARAGAGGDRRGRAPAPAREVPVGAGRRSAGRTSRSPRPARSASSSPRATGGMCTTLPKVLITLMGIEKVLPEWRDLEVMLQLLPALLDGRADEPVHVDLDRRARRRRAARVPSRAARRGPHPGAGRRGRPPGAALHPLLGLPELLPGLLAHRRARVRVGLSGPDRRDPHAAARRPRRGADAAVGVVAVRRLLRGLPGQDRHPAGARAPARAGGAGGQARWSPERLAMDALARVFRSRSRLRARAADGAGRERPDRRACPGRSSGWTEMRELPEVPRETFREWWQATAGAQAGGSPPAARARDGEPDAEHRR